MVMPRPSHMTASTVHCPAPGKSLRVGTMGGGPLKLPVAVWEIPTLSESEKSLQFTRASRTVHDPVMALSTGENTFLNPLKIANHKFTLLRIWAPNSHYPYDLKIPELNSLKFSSKAASSDSCQKHS